MVIQWLPPKFKHWTNSFLAYAWHTKMKPIRFSNGISDILIWLILSDSEYFCVTEDIVEDQGNKKKMWSTSQLTHWFACCGTNIEKLKGKLLPRTGIYNFAQCISSILNNINLLVTCYVVQCFMFCHVLFFFLPAGRVRSAWPAGPKITLRFPRLFVYMCVRTYHVRNNCVT